MNITPRNMSIRALFQSTFFSIPRFQRPYSWDRGNIEDFWSDVVDSGTKDYFIGSMVFFGSANGQYLNVVDGQQRLTTITIFLAALRDALLEVGEGNLAQGVQNIIQRPDLNSQQRYVLETESSYPYFQEFIQKMGTPDLAVAPTEEEKGMASAYEYALEGFRSIMRPIQTSSDSPSKKKNLLKKRLEATRDALLSLDVIVVQLDNDDDAYIVFETLNTRGKDLEPKDLIKNHLTRLLPARSPQVDAAKIKWNNVLLGIDASAANINPSTYLHHHWLSTYDYTPEKTLYKRVKRQIRQENAGDYLDSLLADVEPYRRIFEPDNFVWSREEESLKRSLMALAIFKVRQPTPLVLALLRSYYSGRISLRQARDTLAAVERFHFLHTAVAGQSSSGGVSMMYAAAARDLTAENDQQRRARHLQEFRRRLHGRPLERELFDVGFAGLRYSRVESRSRPLIAYMLEKADRLLRQGDAPVDYQRMTIEHISPQSPPAGTAMIAEYPMIGNLILVSEEVNNALQNRSFQEKKVILENAGVPLDPVLRNAQEWNGEKIHERTRVLSGLIFAAES